MEFLLTDRIRFQSSTGRKPRSGQNIRRVELSIPTATCGYAQQRDPNAKEGLLELVSDLNPGP